MTQINSNPTFTVASTSDVESLIPMMLQLRSVDAALLATTNEAALRDALRKLIDDPALGRVWRIQCDGAAAGYVAVVFSHSLEFGGRVAFVDEMFVAADYRRRGVGRAALEFADSQARALGALAVMLEVSPLNKPALRLYQSLGFVPRDYSMMVRG